ncbi:MAG: type II toxin-antitoxin system VapC family toxin [Pseudomonadota bacterium]|nr:type II toxin-antitoxin system VapC family toxin [Pseudomonadota bacterium]
MIAVDTNVLVRILIDDPGQPEQVQAARALASQATKVWVPLIVLVECVWVLESAYRLDKAAVITALTHLHINAAFVLQDETTARKALNLFRASPADFSDCVILAQAQREGLDLYTFDKKLIRLEGAYAVQPQGI